MTKQEYREYLRVRRKLASLKSQGFIKKYAFSDLGLWVTIHRYGTRDVWLWPVSVTMKRLAKVHFEIVK